MRSLTIRGTLRWDTSIDGLELHAGYVLVERGSRFELGTYEQPMQLRATIRLLDNQAEHPYIGKRFLAIDGLAVSSLDTTAVTGAASDSRPMVTIFVVLPVDVEPGQTFNVEHGGQVPLNSGDAHLCAFVRVLLLTPCTCHGAPDVTYSHPPPLL